ncbi:MAG: 3-deoxy-manno-octulosonate cytidylyltransferase [Acidobacteriota bacterium]
MPAPHEASAPRIVGAIPARYGASRFPGKPLARLDGRPMIEHVVRRARQADALDDVVVLTDDARIADAVRGFGGAVEMTPADCASGTDRIAWALARWAAGDGLGAGGAIDAVVNIQGDEPLIEPEAIARVADHLRDHPAAEMVTLAAPLPAGALDDPNRVKVVTRLDGDALYFSRAPIPHARVDGPASVAPRLHVGLYGYRRDVLLRLAALPPAALERTESLEQLRALAHGIAIRVLDVAHAAIGVDTPADLARLEAQLSRSTPSDPPTPLT